MLVIDTAVLCRRYREGLNTRADAERMYDVY